MASFRTLLDPKLLGRKVNINCQTHGTVSPSTIQHCPIEDDEGTKERTKTETKAYWAGLGGVSSGGTSRVTPIMESYSSSW